MSGIEQSLFLNGMLCLSIRQPWAEMILRFGKDVENRTWPTNVRGRVLIHAAKGMTADEWADAWGYAEGVLGRELPTPHTMQVPRGGIVGAVEIVDCVRRSDSPWFMGPCGFVLRDPRPLPFIPYKGALGFFKFKGESCC